MSDEEKPSRRLATEIIDGLIWSNGGDTRRLHPLQKPA